MLCPVCHTQNRDNARFCKGCGLALNTSSETAGTAAQAQQSAAPQLPLSTATSIPQAEEEQGSFVEATVPVPEPPTSRENAAQVPTTNEGTTTQEEDVSLAPTQILTPQQMMEIQSRRWQRDAEREHAEHVSDQEQQAGDIADMPTISVPPLSDYPTVPATPAPTATATQNKDIADMPTVLLSPSSTGSEVPPPPPPDSLAPQQGTPATPAYIEEANALAGGALPPLPESLSNVDNTQEPVAAQQIPTETGGETEGMEQEQQSSQANVPTAQAAEQPQQPEAPQAPAGDFPVLTVGTQVMGRYEITQVMSDDTQEHVYQVVDHQGYQRCWNCGSSENTEGDEFCIDCGAELLNASYLMHEYPASAQPEGEQVVPDTIVNSFVDQGHTYIVEQPQTTQNPFPNGVHLLAASSSDAGDVRRSEPNEDSTLVLQLQRVHESIASPIGVFIVADGLGGHENGQLASRMTIGAIANRLVSELILPPLEAEKKLEEPALQDEDSLVVLLRSAVEEANTALVQTNQRDKTDMGSTITGFMIVKDLAYILNVGDSRTYMLRDGNLYQLTTDHSLVGQLVAGGLIEPDDVYTHPQRSQIYRSLGDKQHVQIDVIKQQIHPGDILLSCSDGLWEMVRNPQITDILNNAPDPQTACTNLINAANTNGGEDNVSAVVVHVR